MPMNTEEKKMQLERVDPKIAEKSLRLTMEFYEDQTGGTFDPADFCRQMDRTLENRAAAKKKETSP